jgi:alpha-glucosidase (family GH31 glycosyl hydrolase)
LKRAAGLLLWIAAQLAAADLVSHERAGNRVVLRVSDGEADIEWLSESTFRFRRVWSGSLSAASARAEVTFTLQDEPAAVLMTTEHLRLRVLKRGLLLEASNQHGTPLLADAAETRRHAGEIVVERRAPEGIRYYGLGPRTEETLDARGLLIRPGTPFLISSAGYGEYHRAPGTYSFDLAKERSDRYKVTARGASRLDFSFYYGPNPKDVFEEHLSVQGAIPSVSPSRLRAVTRQSLPSGAWMPPASLPLANYVRSIVHASMSAALLPVFDVGAFEGPLAERAAQIGAIAPLVMNGRRDGRLIPFLLTYTEEAKDRGFPVIRAMPVQYPRDTEAGCCADQFMLGDELLIAPILTAESKRSVYLPMGFWTHWRSGEEHKGRQTITVNAAADELPMFVKNGAILPLLQPDSAIDLHYFPKLAAEFFIYEYDIGDYTQVHAAPAARDMRLEIETKKARAYRWFVHHIAKPSRLVSGEREYVEVKAREQLREGAWHWDAQSRRLAVHVKAAPDAAHVVNISF